MQLHSTERPFTILMFTTLSLCPLSTHALDAHSLLQQCIPDTASPSHQSKVEVHITHKNAPEEVHHFGRLEDERRLFLRPQDNGGMGFLVERQNQQQWLYDAERRSLLPLSAEQKYPEWLLSESLLDVKALATFALTISSQSTMGGQSYYTVTATAGGHDPFPKRTLSFKIDSDQTCDLIRAAYFDADQKLRKKIYVQWQPLADTKMLKALHIEDVQSLEAVRYHIDEVQVVDGFNAGEFPAMP
jgi:Outer membrane lipoprotein-sorting protein